MAKYLKFIKCDDGHHVVLTKRSVVLGTTMKRGEIFKRSPVFLDLRDECEFTSNCLRELAAAIDSQYGKESAEKSDNKLMDAIALLDEFVQLYSSYGISLELAEFYDKVCEWKE